MSEPDRPSARQRLKDRYSAKPLGAAYQGAMESVFSIVIGVLLGWWADSSFGSSPWCLIAGATIGFGAFVLRLSRLGAALDASPEDEGKDGES
jgi:F0F1-type ATP synthase assembly protein I